LATDWRSASSRLTKPVVMAAPKFQNGGSRFHLHCALESAQYPTITQEHHMSKGIDRKKETKKKPAMNLMQKRAAKAEKKKNK
jgi:hypothetical protein